LFGAGDLKPPPTKLVPPRAKTVKMLPTEDPRNGYLNGKLSARGRRISAHNHNYFDNLTEVPAACTGAASIAASSSQKKPLSEQLLLLRY
jgi:hypothetical protein